jgi:hypothetical protein
LSSFSCGPTSSRLPLNEDLIQESCPNGSFLLFTRFG